MNDRSELLDQLKIDRTVDHAAGGWSPLTAMILAALACAIGGGAVWLLLPREASPPPAVAAPRAAADDNTQAPGATPTPERRDIDTTPAPDQQILNASGYITARQIATVSSEITGLITEVNVEEGMVVEAGQVLARLDDALARVDLQLANAQMVSLSAAVDSIKASLGEAERVYSRAQNLRARELVSDADLTRSKAEVDRLAADLRRAEAELEVSRLSISRQQERLADHVIRAPFAGVVTVKNAQTGEIVSPGSAGGGFTRTGICTIVDMDSLEIEVDVNEAFIGRVFAGQRVEAVLDAYPDWEIPASVVAIIPTADRAKATVRVRIGIEASDARILPDMGVKVAFLRQ